MGKMIKRPFYYYNDLYKFDNKNVVYVAYVGSIRGENIYKYGKTVKLFEREYKSHRQNFDIFDMQMVKITDNKDIIEEMFKKELIIRNINRQHIIRSKKQTELFTTTDDYSLDYILHLLDRLVKENPSYEVLMYKTKLEKLQASLKKRRNI